MHSSQRMRRQSEAPGATVPHGWRQLYGDFDRLGVSVEWHDFQTEQPLDWGSSFHPRSVEFCLNLEGRGAVGGQDDAQADYVPGSAGYYALTDQPLPASRQARDHHQFVTLEFSREHLQKQLADCEADLDPQLRAAVFPGKEAIDCLNSRGRCRSSSTMWWRLCCSRRFRKRPRALWYQSKALELMAHFLFTPKDPELFCMRQKRVARDRVARDEGIARARSGESADARDARTGSWLQSVLSEPEFLARSRPDHSAISCASCAWNARPSFCAADVTMSRRPRPKSATRA